ncbi:MULTISPECIES: acyl-CoA dehydrogenase family protein [Hyphomonas]|uniref:Acyl-CoA dehydrogenase family protein n=2 Tax=Hyphomonas adhaerens TaxID=81029 RepID=A0A069E567_9PROT|nr:MULTISPECIES: acyl-CoA dehydrogenase family protein [Hyphomonas]KCZ85445.1 acyl-CoA dehydrogenase family protein [Hyphomonas adhaerens MHS-3]MBB41252.1 acyl-CoA dehydrogenase [Hyphomonas sp.]HAE25787.1 acyl-CoA dehydrogenase [Hyphomonas adhaerens]|tara:strand:- start:4231 stop:5367 length:1137 start_codon:yes stop_codon:yes gene_type:complete
MTFLLTEDQEMLRETAMAFARDELPVTHLRALRDSGANGKDPATRQKLAELGFFGVIVPEEPGGEHFGLVGLGQILEAQGRTLAATPLLQTALIGASAIQLGGTPAQQAEWLPKIAGGDVTFALALDESAHFNPLNVATEAERNGQGYTLNGEKRFVPDGHHADMLIVVARTFGEAGDRHGLSLFLVPADAKGVSIQELKTADSHGAAHITLTDVMVGEGALIGAADEGADVLEPVLDRAAIGQAAEMLGSSQAAFEMTLEYLQSRKQFGQLIGSFQSLQHRAAKMFTELEMTRSCVAAALSAADEGKTNVAELASLAKARASELVHLVSNECVQMHGGIGMTDVADPGLYMKRARTQEAMYGSASWHRDRYAKLNGY